MEEGASLTTRLADEFEPPVRDALRAEAQENKTHAAALRKILRGRTAFSLD